MTDDNLPDAVWEYRRRRNRAMVNGEPIVSQARADAAIDALIEERERLKVCGTCRECIAGVECYADASADEPKLVSRVDPCHFTPTRYVPYWKEGK